MVLFPPIRPPSTQPFLLWVRVHGIGPSNTLERGLVAGGLLTAMWDAAPVSLRLGDTCQRGGLGTALYGHREHLAPISAATPHPSSGMQICWKFWVPLTSHGLVKPWVRQIGAARHWGRCGLGMRAAEKSVAVLIWLRWNCPTPCGTPMWGRAVCRPCQLLV